MDEMEGFREVTKAEFFAAMNPLNVHPRPKGNYPYVTDWEMQDGSRRLVGRSLGERYGLKP